MPKYNFYCYFIIIGFTGCFQPLQNPNDENDIQSMKKIPSKDISFQQGWNDPHASQDEKPDMRSSFTYNFWIDSTEVTQKQYANITGKRPVSDSSRYGVGGEYPVYNVSWFDAILFCNARSKVEKLDTVYAYFDKKMKSDGSVYNLIGIQCDYSKNGYRLPTEAEWEFAARGGNSALPYQSIADTLNAMMDGFLPMLTIRPI